VWSSPAAAPTLTGVLATDMVTGVMKPTLQAAATNAAIPFGAVLTADTCTLSFFGVGTGYTPTASEVYGIRTARIAPAAPLVVFTQTLTPTSVAALTTAEQTFTITTPNALVAGSPVWINKPSWTNGLAIMGVRVSAANTLAITFANMTASAIVPPAEAYVIGNFQVPLPGAGNVRLPVGRSGRHRRAEPRQPAAHGHGPDRRWRREPARRARST
jgi:hypothetical protein